jgi:hypothetical protein
MKMNNETDVLTISAESGLAPALEDSPEGSPPVYSAELHSSEGSPPDISDWSKRGYQLLRETVLQKRLNSLTGFLPWTITTTMPW